VKIVGPDKISDLLMDETRTLHWVKKLQRIEDPNFLVSPYFIRSFIGSSAFGYGIYSIAACLLLKRGIPINRGYLVSIPAFTGLLGWQLSQDDPFFVYDS